MLTAKDISEFRGYLKNCTDRQVQGVFDKETLAGRADYAELARVEAEHRGMELQCEFQVIVGNIGTVYCGPDFNEAESAYDEYLEQSKSEVGRAAGESVTMMYNNSIHKEYAGTICDW